jgi:P27 family predicted phage terminase small subunit
MAASDPVVAGRIERPNLPRAPNGLSPSSRRLWKQAVGEFVFGPAELALLESACRSWQRAEQARELLDREGITTVSAAGMHHPHPAVRIERDAAREFRICWAKLGLVDPSGGG